MMVVKIFFLGVESRFFVVKSHQKSQRKIKNLEKFNELYRYILISPSIITQHSVFWYVHRSILTSDFKGRPND
ncbi:hypothetical protein BpHYR1_032334 [Brachionus plicatilis]|uniref:Uncharacterized protein n=1 Tax=Brachionus plicatilis TaxID=10195 RepID=A0A3M7S186_BRAPC|nr:hypothetical protein BpHYR1_032334 [Brachionus plicatilis]